MLYGSPVQPNQLANAFLEAMRENRYVDGRDFAFDLRYFDTSDELERVVADLLPLKPDVIVTSGSPAAWAAKKAISTIPIVTATVADPVEQGLVASLAKPGGNLTGNAILTEVGSTKRMELMHEMLPKARRIAVLGSSSSNHLAAFRSKRLETAAKQLLLRESTSAVDTVLDEIARQRPEALLVLGDPIFWPTPTRAKIAQVMLRYKVSTIPAFTEAVAEGGLMSYAHSTEAMFRRAAMFVVRILKGAKPSDLPIEQPTKFELVINLKTAKALGLTIPPSLLLRADHVIE